MADLPATHRPRHYQPPPAEQQRPTSGARGYDYQWQKLRLVILNRHPVCQDCNKQPSTEVHHLEKIKAAPERRLHDVNLRALCTRCHNLRTIRGE